jgi:hypothetical protein
VVNVRKPRETLAPETENTVVGTRITKPMYEAVLKCLTLDSRITVSDYLRDLLRRDLEKKGFLRREAQTVE